MSGMRCFAYCGDDKCICDARCIPGSMIMGESIPQKDDVISIFTKEELDKTQEDLALMGSVFTERSFEYITIAKTLSVISYFRSSDVLEKITLHSEWDKLNRSDFHDHELTQDSHYTPCVDASTLTLQIGDIVQTHSPELEAYRMLTCNQPAGDRLPWVDQTGIIPNVFFDIGHKNIPDDISLMERMNTYIKKIRAWF